MCREKKKWGGGFLGLFFLDNPECQSVLRYFALSTFGIDLEMPAIIVCFYFCAEMQCVCTKFFFQERKVDIATQGVAIIHCSQQNFLLKVAKNKQFT